jgi:topoisomerase-4 subunit B
LNREESTKDMLDFYMGKNTPDRQDFIIENLRIEEDMVEEEAELG